MSHSPNREGGGAGTGGADLACAVFGRALWGELGRKGGGSSACAGTGDGSRIEVRRQLLPYMDIAVELGRKGGGGSACAGTGDEAFPRSRPCRGLVSGL